MDIPPQLSYTSEHEWCVMDGTEVIIGITRFAADQLGDIVFVELPAVATKLQANQSFGTVESVKSVSDLYMPVTGTVTAVNAALNDAPQLVNEDPYRGGWMIRIQPDDPHSIGQLMSAEQYRDHIGSANH
ncbi:MAG: glycine cleavage system protein GcvH [Magnetococcales bacterium]|nr:glycine cleavage system protein GcvH [Magnetococcales bacterium]